MENKYINRYNTFCQSLKNLEKSRNADPKADFVLEGTVQNFNLTFDISWKVMKDILIKRMGVMDFAVGSPRETLQSAYMNGLIFDDEWMQMKRYPGFHTALKEYGKVTEYEYHLSPSEIPFKIFLRGLVIIYSPTIAFTHSAIASSLQFAKKYSLKCSPAKAPFTNS